ncbi:MAG: hypothetical protein IT443_11690 [Phycisphaeraceae bacterium]|nr:hypothetical protein [Phycisphaeraceae bacterium]
MKPNHPLRKAFWMWTSQQEFLHNSYAQFRKDFDLSAVPKKVPFFVSADQQYMLYANGKFVTRGPARGYQFSWPFDEVDLAPYLQKGHNWLCILAYNAGKSTYQYLTQSYAGVICAGQCGPEDLASGGTWKGRPASAYKRDTARLSVQLNFQEQFDARLDDDSWLTAPQLPEGWGIRKANRVYGAMPWHDMEERGIPNLGNDWLPYRNTCSAAAGPSDAGYESWFNIAHGFYSEHERLSWKPAPAGHADEKWLTLTLPAAGKGQLAAVSVDLGILGVGTLNVEATGGAGTGDMIDFYFTEGLHDDGRPIVTAPGQGCDASMASRLYLRAGAIRHELFQIMGHRYLVAIARDTTAPLELKLALRHTAYPLDIKGRFESDDPVLNDIYRISVRTQQVCALDAYVDTPWREQAQWWGDARVQGQNTFHLAADARLVARGIRSIARQEVPNGLTYGHAPTMSHHCILPDFSLIWLVSIWDHYYQTGDITLFKEQWPRALRMLTGYFDGEAKLKNGMVGYDPRYWLFLDWTTIYRDGTPAVLNLWYLFALEKLLAMAAVARMTKEKAYLTKLYQNLKKAILAKLWDAKEKLFFDGIDPKGKPVNLHSPHTQTLAILCNLHPECHANMIQKRLLPYLNEEKVEGGRPSSFWVTYVYSVMRAAGFGRQCVEHIKRHWAPMIPYGGTWESFPNEDIGGGKTQQIGNGTCSHAWAAHPIYHLPGSLGGITQADVAWKKITFAPVLDVPDTHRASAAVPTPKGLIQSSWSRQGDSVQVSLSLPRGIEALVSLPNQKPAKITGKKTWRLKSPTA